MPRFAIVALLLLTAWNASLLAKVEEVTALATEEMPDVTAVTAFHSFNDKAHKLIVRLIEADASADVAKNPVGLYVVITNDASGPDLQQFVWRIPGVSQIHKVSLGQSELRLSAAVDGIVNEETGRLPEHQESWRIAYAMKGDQLSDKLRVTTSRP